MVYQFKYHFSVLLAMLLFSCSKDPPLWKIENLNNNSITVLGHGGLGIYSLYPLNSAESIIKCMQMGADGSEMDVQMSKDSVLLAYHPDKLEEASNCNGYIYEKYGSELACNFKSLIHNNIQITTLSNLFLMQDLSKERVYAFECKLNGQTNDEYLNAFANALIKHIQKFNLEESSLIESTIPNFLRILKSKNPRLKLFMYVNEFDLGVNYANELGLFGLTMDMNKITPEQIKKAHTQNLRVAIFNQQSEKDNLEAIQMNPDYIQTDKLEHLIKILEN